MISDWMYNTRMRRIIAFLCFALLVSSFFTGCDFLLDIGTEKPAVPSADDDSNTLLGFPSDAVSGESQIVEHGAYTLLYDYETLLPVWVSWHLDADDMGNIERRDNFRPDTVLPDAYQVDTDDYTNSGFARGHLCPNADRDGNKERQDETFFMTNIAPQNSSFNSGDWKSLESYCQKQASSGSELFIVAGVYGNGGIDKDGNKVSTYTNPKKDGAKELSIPSHFWKVVVILDDGDGDLARIDEDTVAFAVDFDNAPVPDDLGWEDYAISIDTLESRTGLDFLSTLPDDIENALESKIQAGI